MRIYGNMAGRIHPDRPQGYRKAISRCKECCREWPTDVLEDGRCPECRKYERAKRELRSWRAKDAWRRKHG